MNVVAAQNYTFIVHESTVLSGMLIYVWICFEIL